jgi:hypothetical protein
MVKGCLKTLLLRTGFSFLVCGSNGAHRQKLGLDDFGGLDLHWFERSIVIVCLNFTD